jgi:4-fold beta-flower domain-containing protein
MIELWDQHGAPVAYVDDDGESIYLWNGTPVGWLSEDSIHAYSGRFLGWLVDGWVQDTNGDCVFFTDAARDGPVFPQRQVRPVKGVRGATPVRGIPEVRPTRPLRSPGWTRTDSEAWFEP